MASITSASTDKRSSSSNDRRSFGLFPYLNDDLKRVILSFVADAPMETTHGAAVPPINYVKSSLTHQLPLVSRKFRDFSQSDSYWKDAVLRQTKKEPILWETALREIIAQSTVAGENASKSNDDEAITSSSHDKEPRDALALVQRALEAHHHQQQQQQEPQDTTTNCEHHHSSLSSPTTRTTYKSLYRHVVSNHLRFKGPVFFMPGNVQLGEPYALHFFEPRYRFLIAEVMRDFPDQAKQGGHIGTDSRNNKVPLFLHANRGPLAATTPAVVVQVLRCEIHDNDNNDDGGHADVVLLPLHHVWLEKVWVSGPRAPGNLYYAQALRMPQQVTHSMNQLARQEILANVMDQIATTLSNDSSSYQEDSDEDDDDDAMDSSDDSSSSDDDDDSLDDDDQSDVSDSDVDDDDDIQVDDEDDFENAQGP